MRMPKTSSRLRSLGPITLALSAAMTPACARDATNQGGTEQPAALLDLTLVAGSGTVVLTPAEAKETLCQLYATLDRDCDRRLTILDQQGTCEHPPCSINVGVKLSERLLTLHLLHHASQLATELAEGLSSAQTTAASGVPLELSRVYQNPVNYLRERIETRYWEGLTRRVSTDPERLWSALADEKQGNLAVKTANWCEPAEPRCAPAVPESEETRADSSAPGNLPDPSATGSSATGPGATGSSPTGAGAAVPSAAVAARYLYIPESDPGARALYAGMTTELPIRVDAVPRDVSPNWVNERTRQQQHGLLSLARDEAGVPLPFVVPGGRFNEMYGWDSYFIALGLLASDERELARAMAEHQAYEITHYGKVLNANRTYYLTRSQPPFFPSLVRHVLGAAESGPGRELNAAQRSQWLDRMLAAAEKEYTSVWSAPPRRTSVCDGDVCLARYYGEGTGQPPEVEPGHYAQVYQAYAVKHSHCQLPEKENAEGAKEFTACVGRVERDYTSGTLKAPELDEFFVNDRCVRESGHDTTFRWFDDGKERCTDYVTVDLNSLLLQYELDVAALLAATPEHQERVQTWCRRAERRAGLLHEYLWDATSGAFFDYDTRRKQRSTYLAATTLYPLWVNPKNACGVQVLSPAEAGRLVTVALERLEAPGGLLASSPESLEAQDKPHLWEWTGARMERRVPARQWEAPNGWAPHQMIAWRALQQHGYDLAAQRLAYRWLLLIAENAANFHGTVPEKFDVVRRTHEVFAEYGNVNTDFAYIATEGFGWMNASFVVGQQLLTPSQRDALLELAPVESVFRNPSSVDAPH